MNMSYREKIVWCSLIATLFVFGGYFMNIVRMAMAGPLDASHVLGLFIGAVVVQTLLLIGIGIVFAIDSPQAADQPSDERDAAINLRAYRWGYLVLLIGIVISITGIVGLHVLSATPFARTALQPAMLVQPLLFWVVLAEGIRMLSQAIGYRRGA